MKVDRAAFYALAVGLWGGAACAAPSRGQPALATPQAIGNDAEPEAPSTEDEEPDGECVAWDDEGCTQWENHEAGLSPGLRCLSWAPTGECVQWEPYEESGGFP